MRITVWVFSTNHERPAPWRAVLLLITLALAGCGGEPAITERRVSAGDRIEITPRPDAPVTAWLSNGDVFWASASPLTPKADLLVLDGSEAFVQLLTRTPAPGPVRRAFARAGTGVMVLSQDGSVIEILRFVGSPAVERTALPDAPYEAELFLPLSTPPEGAPAIVLLPGTGETGLPAYARYLASLGFAVLLADFNDGECWKQPEIDDIAELARLITAHPRTSGPPVLVGLSASARGAILTAARHRASVRGVVAIAGYDYMLAAPRANTCAQWRAAWRIGGDPAPFIAPSEAAQQAFAEALQDAREADAVFTEAELRAGWVADAPMPQREAAAVPISEVDVPVLIIAGGQDGLSDTASAARRLAERSPRVCAVIFQDAGHGVLSMPWAMISDPIRERNGVKRSSGGSAQANWRAYPQTNTLLVNFAKAPGCPAGPQVELR